MIILKSDRKIDYMRVADACVTQTLVEVKEAVKPGVFTLELDKIAEKYIRSSGAVPSFTGYGEFPRTACDSVNEAAVHRVFRLEKLKNGDTVSVDVRALIYDFKGTGKKMHEDPQIPHYGFAGRGPRLRAGITIAIEPMINLGTHEVTTLEDEWTVMTQDDQSVVMPEIVT